MSRPERFRFRLRTDWHDHRSASRAIMSIAHTLVLSNFIFMGALPSLMFRRAARFSLMWWVTAAPFLICGRLMALARSGEVAPWIGGGTIGWVAGAVAIACSGLSILLILAAWRAHRRPPALWHQQDDQPDALVTHGAYARIRHPLYTAYALALVAAALALPHPATLATLASGWAVLDLAARREERRLEASPLGAAYAAYAQHTGRFWPRLRSATAAEAASSR